jgi:hypothetical protein
MKKAGKDAGSQSMQQRGAGSPACKPASSPAFFQSNTNEFGPLCLFVCIRVHSWQSDFFTAS